MKVIREAPGQIGGRPPELAVDAHKGNAGRVLVIAGSREMPGAAILCTRAALRGGAGLVTLACLDQQLMQLVPGAVPEAILWDLGGPAADAVGFADGAIEEGLRERAIDVIVVGPGLGESARTEEVLGSVLKGWGGPLVLDADALNVLSESEQLRGLVRGRVALDGKIACTILTPHPGEARRLVGGACGRSEQRRLQVAAAIAGDLAAIVCLKGAGTVTTDGELAAINGTGNAGMATAGSGDVLAGLLGAFLAQLGGDFTPFAAARAAVFVHGHAGDLAAGELGKRALIASDLVERLGRAESSAPWA